MLNGKRTMNWFRKSPEANPWWSHTVLPLGPTLDARSNYPLNRSFFPNRGQPLVIPNCSFTSSHIRYMILTIHLVLKSKIWSTSLSLTEEENSDHGQLISMCLNTHILGEQVYQVDFEKPVTIRIGGHHQFNNLQNILLIWRLSNVKIFNGGLIWIGGKFSQHHYGANDFRHFGSKRQPTNWLTKS